MVPARNLPPPGGPVQTRGICGHVFETVGKPGGSRTLRSRFFRLGLLQVVAVGVVLLLAAAGGAAASYNGSHAGALRGAELQANQVLVDMLQQERTLRDQYAVTGDRAAELRYVQARAATGSALHALEGGTAGSTRPGLVRPVLSSVAAWQWWAEGLRQQVRTSGPLSALAPGLKGGDGLFVSVQTALSALAAALEADFKAALNLATGTGVAVEVFATLGDLVVVLVLVLLLRRMYLLALRPLGELATASDTIAAGGRSPIPHARRDDEIGVLSRALRNWEAVTREREAYLADQRRQTARAARIQRDLWPRIKPGLDSYEVAGACRPAQDVAGDFFDWHEWPNGLLDITVADVMGKGIGAALVMASLRAGLRAAAESLGPAERLETAASSITLGSDDEGLFVTVFHCRLDPESGELRFADAGHGYCAIRRASGELVGLGARSLPVGIQPDQKFREGRMTLSPGDMLVVYSDGLVERPDGTVELDAFADDLERAEDADDAVRRLLEHTPAPQSDDVTALVLRRLQPVTPAASSGDPRAGPRALVAAAAGPVVQRPSSEGTPVLRIKGRLDAVSHTEVRDHVHELVRSGATNVVLDFSEVVSLDSAGLGAVISGLKLVRQAGGDLRIALANQQVRTTLRLTSLDRVLRPYTSIDEAIAGLQSEEIELTVGGLGDAREYLDAVRLTLGRFLDSLSEPPSDEWRMLFELAVAEIAANIIEHAQPHSIHFEVRARGGKVTAGFTDSGQGWISPPGPAAMVDDMVERGRGLLLARTAVDEVAYERRGNANHWRLAKRLEQA
jgi:anti-anti-sigma factor